MLDHAGYLLLPLFVICRVLRPMRSTIAICCLPHRVLTKAMCRPFGANAALSLSPTFSLTVRIFRSLMLIMSMTWPGAYRSPDVNAISLNGSGDHVGLSEGGP